jgi:aerobic-type carbon monoxide dehydrogenase small subunit (CoxS/CutS family)
MAGVPMSKVVNGTTPHTVTLDVRASLLDVVREHLGLSPLRSSQRQA